MNQQVVSDQGAQAVGADQVGVGTGDRLQETVTTLFSEIFVFRPLGDHASVPFDFFRDLTEAPAAVEKVTDSVYEPVEEQVTDSFYSALWSHCCGAKDIIVGHEAGFNRSFLVPVSDSSFDGIVPLSLPVQVGFLMADSVNAKDIKITHKISEDMSRRTET